MSPLRHRSSFRPRATSRRRLTWVRQILIPPALAAGSTNTIDLLAPLSLVSQGGYTVMRTHIKISWPYVAATDHLTLGVIKARDTDIGSGAGHAPDPAVDLDLGWAWWSKYYATTSGGAVDVHRELEVDIRSKRKLPQMNDRWVVSFHNSNAAAASYAVTFSSLVALP